MCTTPPGHPGRRYTHRSTPSDPAARIGDPERERAAAGLGLALAQGYLSMEEYESRLSHAFSAQSAGDLSRLTADLPMDQINRRDPRLRAARLQAARRGLQLHWLGYLALSLLMVGIWLAVGLGSGAWYFWPVWPILGVGIGVVTHTVGVIQMRSSDSQDLKVA